MSHPVSNQLIAFLVRETGWNLEYIGKLPVDEALALAAELRHQKSVEEYNASANFAMLMTMYASAHSRRSYRLEDFIGPPPQRQKEEEQDLWTGAEANGIKIPSQR